MVFRESAEREVLVREEEELLEEETRLQEQASSVDVPVEDRLRIEAIALECDRLRREIGELQQRKLGMLGRQRLRREGSGREAAILGILEQHMSPRAAQVLLGLSSIFLALLVAAWITYWPR